METATDQVHKTRWSRVADSNTYLAWPPLPPSTLIMCLAMSLHGGLQVLSRQQHGVKLSHCCSLRKTMPARQRRLRCKLWQRRMVCKPWYPSPTSSLTYKRLLPRYCSLLPPVQCSSAVERPAMPLGTYRSISCVLAVMCISPGNQSAW